MKILKAGCFLINKQDKTVALVYRKQFDDYSFPKGHLEKSETLEDCAIRETAEETKRIAKIVKEFEPYINNYVTLTGKECSCYMYLAIDNGASDNKSKDTHPTYWIPFEQVEDKLTYQNLKDVWNSVKDKILSLIN